MLDGVAIDTDRLDTACGDPKEIRSVFYPPIMRTNILWGQSYQEYFLKYDLEVYTPCEAH